MQTIFVSIYLNNTWKPKRHTILKDPELSDLVHGQGFAKRKLLNEAQLIALTTLYRENHNLGDDKGGMFYSIYSQDLAYRKKIHDGIAAIIQPAVDALCEDYKMMLNSFVVKVSGPESEFYLHQDTTGLDEWKHSPLSLWIPLQDVDEENGCLGIIPFSQHFFSPYRSISFPSPFDHIQEQIKPYLQPQAMFAGEVLIFDNRVLHHSYKNTSGKDRIALICGLFPADAEMQTCHKAEYVCGSQVELLAHDDDFLLKGKNFLIDCQKRPETGESLGFRDDPYVPIQLEEFEALCEQYGVSKQPNSLHGEQTNCQMIAEPVLTKEEEPGFWDKIKALF